MLLRRLARPLLATTFIVDGVDTLIHPEPRAKTAATLVQRGERTLPDKYAAKLPADPGTVVRVNAFAQVSAGVLLALGKTPRLASLVLAATVVPATITEQNFWDEEDPDRKNAKRTAFLKDLGLLGGLMIAAADTEGKPSLGWRGRKAASAAAAALPFTGSSDSQTAEVLRERAHEAAVRAQKFGEIAAAKGAVLAETAQHRGTELAEVAKHRGPEIASTAKEHGSEWAEYAKEHGSEWAEIAKKRGAEFAEIARERAAELAEIARQRGSEFAEAAQHKGTELADTARERGPELAHTARERSAYLAEAARERAEAARERAEARRH
ncbi:DoxX family protein [Nocardia goodfellowii]|uniref:Membrane protein YphA (DoxX/SURF4 family)/gas vesicle protein n=1 Tax=Nocardia goodfellowii TaxID=882446 RepID=A0ABS4QCV4_9NOCA|nr:DoxX family protein [Nocardia goodfellowii]MBP2189527.1 putative membrane protein YphA (DoxX/SURF4 family)/gas vesicle protein [Nocardia goodfellowii]